ncbi:MAG: gliding motility lipoprotein GldD [Putridiphycobacter sp.]|nr:gliding motility lipoprotein GldD [Putridiphycobacter sp.]
MKMIKQVIFAIGFGFMLFACEQSEEVYPKPLSAMKIDFPEKNFDKTVTKCSYSFLTSTYTEIDSSRDMCNLNLNYTALNATLFLTYIPIDTGLQFHIETARKMVYDHSIKADAIEEKTILNPKQNVFGTAYKLIGNSASNYQFYVTDSIQHFLRGALYFNCPPNYDSLKPSIEFLLPDVDTLVNTLQWSAINEI